MDAKPDRWIGDLWRRHARCGTECDEIRAVIRKLVERERLHRPNDPTWLILRDFGIDPATWED